MTWMNKGKHYQARRFSVHILISSFVLPLATTLKSVYELITAHFLSFLNSSTRMHLYLATFWKEHSIFRRMHKLCARYMKWNTKCDYSFFASDAEN